MACGRMNLILLILLLISLLVSACSSRPAPSTPTPPTAVTIPSTIVATIPTKPVLRNITLSSTPIAIPSSTSKPSPSFTPIPPLTPTSIHTIYPFEVIREIAYAANGDARQTLSLYLPRENRRELTMLLYGGEGFPKLVEHFVESGYPVIAFNSRNDYYLSEIRDGFCALAWAHANAEIYRYDPQKIVSVGGSMWGGTAAILGLVDDPVPFLGECPYKLPDDSNLRAVITLAGVFDYSEEGDFFDGFIEAIISYMGGKPDQVPENWAAASAITWVRGDAPPFLLIHGEADRNVNQHQSEKFAAALQGVGTEVTLVLLPGVNHVNSVTRPEVFDEMQSYLEKLEKPHMMPSDQP